MWVLRCIVNFEDSVKPFQHTCIDKVSLLCGSCGVGLNELTVKNLLNIHCIDKVSLLCGSSGVLLN